MVLALVVVACRGNFDERSDSDPGDPENGAWFVGEIGACSDSCTTGTQTRTVECRAENGTVLDDTKCIDEKPWSVRACEETACSWAIGAWDPCTVNCGGGTEARVVECKTASGIVAPDAHCTGTKPAASQACNTAACCRDLTYPMHELPGDGATACSTNIRYMIEADTASMEQRCTEIGYAMYGNYRVVFTQAGWCDFCNARTKNWTGSAWISNGCNGGVQILRCCNLP